MTEWDVNIAIYPSPRNVRDRARERGPAALLRREWITTFINLSIHTAKDF